MGDPLLSSDMEETKTSRARVAFVLLCGLAVCCSVMYVTADGEESVLAEKASVGYLTPGPESVESVDVKKAGLLVTNTPDGRKRLLIFLDKVEAQIAKEVAGRKADIAAVRAQMAKNFAYNQAARSKMKKNLLHKMAINARIAKTNKHIAANAAQIKENAKKARKDLESAMGRFDKKMANVSEEAKKGRSKLAAQAATQDKKFRQWANNKIKTITAQTAAQFRQVRAKMAKDRHHADQMLKHASARMDAALNAHKALQDRRFAQTVSDIAAAKKEAKTRVNQAVTSFKVGILKLSAVVHQQSKKLNNRVTQLSGVIS